jgi:hypothetical protein
MKQKTYKSKFSAKDLAEREEKMLRDSPLFRELRERGFSNRQLTKVLGCRLQYVYDIFIHPVDNMNFKRLKAIADVMPDLSIKDILGLLMPKYERCWYELEDDEVELLYKKLGII